MQNPVLVVLVGVAVSLVLWRGWHRWAHPRNHPVHGAVHGVLGIAGPGAALPAGPQPGWPPQRGR